MPVLSVNDIPAPQAPRQRLIAILLVCLAVAGFTVIDSCAKYLNPRLGPGQTTFLRYFAGFLWILPFLNPWRVPGVLVSERPLLQFVRGALLLASTALNFVALQYLQLAQTVSIIFLAPLIVSLAAGPILGEWPGPRRLAAIAFGFAGVLIVTRPGTGAIHPAAIFCLLNVVCYATILLMTRRLSAKDSPETTMFYSSLLGAVILLPLVGVSWTPPTGPEWLAIVAMGFGAAAGHWLMIQAQRFTDAPVLAPFMYTQIVWMTLSGYLFFGERPDAWTFVGGGVIVASGLYLLHRERVRALEARRARENTPPPP